MKKVTLTAANLRLILTISLLVVEAIGIAFIVNADRELKAYAESVSKMTATANASSNNVQALQKIQQELLANNEVVERTNDIVADSQSYQYQDQIITDLNDYAKRAGISITNIDFRSGEETGTPATPAAPAAPGVAPVPTGVKTTSASVTLKNPVAYEKLLRFVKSIEQNLTKMQISRIGLSKDASGGVTSEVLNIEVYIR